MCAYIAFRTKRYESIKKMEEDKQLMEGEGWIVKATYNHRGIATGEPYWVDYEKVCEVGK